MAINVNPGVADINKVKAEDMNEIKSVVNGNYNEVGDITNLTTTDKTSVVNAINELEGEAQFEDITSQITFTETVATVKFYKVGKVINVQYQGESKAHTVGSTLATIPAQYRPSYQVVAPFIKNSNAYGWLSINSGNLGVSAISSTSAQGRIYANFSYFID